MPYFVQRIAALAALLFLSPVLAVVCVAVAVSSGFPVFYVADRIGKGATVFRQYKFRTMVRNADSLLAEDLGEAAVDRVTPIGKILRVSSLDELPQLLNIFKGDMAIVGPRPLHPSVAERIDPEHPRYTVVPGITGLAQVSGRNNLVWSKRLEYDEEYTTSRSFMFDLRILLRTAVKVLGREDIVMDRNSSEVMDI